VELSVSVYHSDNNNRPKTSAKSTCYASALEVFSTTLSDVDNVCCMAKRLKSEKWLSGVWGKVKGRSTLILGLWPFQKQCSMFSRLFLDLSGTCFVARSEIWRWALTVFIRHWKPFIRWVLSVFSALEAVRWGTIWIYVWNWHYKIQWFMLSCSDLCELKTGFLPFVHSEYTFWLYYVKT